MSLASVTSAQSHPEYARSLTSVEIVPAVVPALKPRGRGGSLFCAAARVVAAVR